MEKQDIEKLLAEGNAIQIKPQGYSMYPLFVPGRDEAVVEPVDTEKLKRGAVALYRRDSGILVLHRIWKKKNDEFYMVGDNQKEIEGPLRKEQIKGVMVAMYRKGKYIPVSKFTYRLAMGIWLLLRPLRPCISKTVAFCKKIFKKNTKVPTEMTDK